MYYQGYLQYTSNWIEVEVSEKEFLEEAYEFIEKNNSRKGYTFVDRGNKKFVRFQDPVDANMFVLTRK